MTTPIANLPALRSSTAALLQGLEDEHWSDSDVHAASLLPGWTRGHVLTHLARNADGIERTVTGALRGERLARYPGGVTGRNADIDAGAPRPIAEQLADVRESSARLATVLDSVADVDGWHLECDDRTVGEYVLGRWREVEIHRVDLGGRYSAGDWPAEFVRYLLPAEVGGLDPRIPDGQALRIEVDPDGSVAELGGTVWSCGGGPEPVSVAAPDWALLAWVLGRRAAAGEAMRTAPDLARWL